jgi:hypothetical protein
MSLTKDAIETLFARAQPHHVVQGEDGTQHVIIPEGFHAHTVPPRDKMLVRIQQAPAFYDAGGFSSYVNRFKSDATRIFALPGHLASDQRARVMAIMDYHAPPSTAAHGLHVATFLPRYSEPWLRWTKAPAMAQVAFAEFVEENRADIVDPDAAVLLDIVSKFKTSRKQEYDSVVYQSNGDVVVAWSDKTENAGKPGVVVPDKLKLGIPIYFRGTVFEVPVFMRYRLADGKLMFQVKVDRADYVEQAAFDEITGKISAETSIEVYLGSR